MVYRNRAYIACKSTPDAPTNDTVLVYDIDDKLWDSPIVGWSVGDMAIYQDGKVEQLYYGDGTTDNAYLVTDQPQDYIYDTVANWRSKAYDFGAPHALKYVTNVFVSGYISPNTSLSISLLCDNDGYTKKWSTTLSGSETAYVFNSSLYNLFGLRSFGTTRFGSQEDLSGKKAFRIYLGKDFQQMSCYTYQLEFASDGANQNWEVLGYGFSVYQAPVPERASLYHSFK
jgi:hypothetical protein